MLRSVDCMHDKEGRLAYMPVSIWKTGMQAFASAFSVYNKKPWAALQCIVKRKQAGRQTKQAGSTNVQYSPSTPDSTTLHSFPSLLQ